MADTKKQDYIPYYFICRFDFQKWFAQKIEFSEKPMDFCEELEIPRGLDISNRKWIFYNFWMLAELCPFEW